MKTLEELIEELRDAGDVYGDAWAALNAAHDALTKARGALDAKRRLNHEHSQKQVK